jgi:predicted permease
MPRSDTRTRIIAQKLFELANIEAGVIVFSEVMGRDVVRWELIMVSLTLFAVLYILGYLLLSPRSKRGSGLTHISKLLPSLPPDSSQPTK